MLPFTTNKAAYICVCVCENAGCTMQCHFDFLSHLSSKLLANYTVGFRNVSSIMLNFMKFLSKMADA